MARASRLGGAALLLLILLLQKAKAEIVFSQAPEDIVIAEGSAASFTCLFTSSNPASVSWHKSGSLVLPSDRISLNSLGLTIDPTESSDEGTYTCNVTDTVDMVSAVRSADLTFAYILNSFLISPSSDTLTAGESTILFCVHGGSLPEASMTWLRDGTELADNSRYTISTEILAHTDPPQTSSSISIIPLVVGDTGEYQCMATNNLLPSSPVYSSIGVLDIHAALAAPSITVHPASEILLSAGLTSVLNCSSSGEPAPSITWQIDGVDVNTDLDKITVESSGGNSTLTITNMQDSEVGRYQCIASNNQGTAYSNNATLQIAFIEENFQIAPVDTSVIVGHNAVVTCSPPLSVPTAIVTWFDDSAEIMPGNKFSVADNGSLLISAIEHTDAGDYYCEARNELLDITRTSDTIQIAVHELPVITSPPSNISVIVGMDFVLTCNSTGVPAPKVTWYKDGVLLTSSNESHLSIQANKVSVFGATLADEGVYICRATNDAGIVEAQAMIDVIPIPSFTDDDVSLTVLVGTDVLVPCNAISDESITLSWTFKGAGLDFPHSDYQLLTNGSLLIESVVQNQEGEYVCTASNSAGSAQGTVQLTVQAKASAQALQNSVTVTQGVSLELECIISGDPPPVVTWYFDGIVVPNPSVQNIELQDQNSTLAFSQVLKSHEGVYTCAADNGISQNNDTITLTVQVSPSISASPISQVVVEGGLAEYSCEAPGAPPPVVSWLNADGTNVLLLNDNRIEVDDSNTLYIGNVTIADDGLYTCSAVNDAGTATVVVSLIVHVPPSVFLSPTLTITNGESFTLDCQPKGVPSPNITWYKDDTLLVSNDRVIISEGGVLMIDNAFSTDNGTYMCVAVNSVKSVSASIDVEVLVLPLIIVPKPIVSVNPNSEALLECLATGKPVPIITWYRGSVPLPDSSFPRYSVSSNESLVISDAQFDEDNGAQFVCRATNEAGTESATVEVKVNVPPKTTAKNASVAVVEEGNTTLSCVVTGDPTPSITWFSGETLITEDAPGFQYLADGQDLAITGAKKSDEGPYICLATNVAGTDEDTVQLMVYIIPKFDAAPMDSTAVENADHTLYCNATGDPVPVVQWSSTDVTYPAGNSLSFTPVSRDDSGDYTCTATNKVGVISDTIFLNVQYAPAIVTAPSDTAVVESNSVTLTCVTDGNPEPSITWLFDGVTITGANMTVYTIDSVSGTDAGEYTCRIQNDLGSDSAIATITVLFTPSAPEITVVEALSSSSLSIEWLAPDDNGGSPILSYTIEYRISGGSVYTSLEVPATPLSATVTGLSPYMEYDVRVSATNAAGQGDLSANFAPAVQTHPAAPAAPSDITFTSESPPTLAVSWGVPVPANGEVMVYEILVNTSSDPSPVVDRTLFGTTQTTISNLESGVTYYVGVRAGTIGIDGTILWGPFDGFWALDGIEVPAPPSTSSTVSSLITSTSSAAMTSTSTPTKTEDMITSTSSATASSSVVTKTEDTSSAVSSTTTVVMPTPSPSMDVEDSETISQSATSSVASSSSSLVTSSVTLSSSLVTSPVTSSSSLVTSSSLSSSFSPILATSSACMVFPPVDVRDDPITSCSDILVTLTPTMSSISSSSVVPTPSSSSMEASTSIVMTMNSSDAMPTSTSDAMPTSTSVAMTTSTSVAMTTSTSIAMTTSTSVLVTPTVAPPPSGPSDIQLIETGGAIVVTWMAPSDGTYDGYHIYTDPAPPVDSGISLPITVSPTLNFVTISGLEGGVTYIVSVATYNTGGDSPAISATIVLSGGTLPTAPTNVVVMSDVLTGMVLVTWGPPDVPGGTLNFYHVEIINTETLEAVLAESVAVAHGMQDSQYSLEAVLLQGTYTVTVAAENNVGLGTPSDILNIQLVQVVSSSSSSLSTMIPTTSSSSLVTTSSSITTQPIPSVSDTESVMTSVSVSSSTSTAIPTTSTTTTTITMATTTTTTTTTTTGMESSTPTVTESGVPTEAGTNVAAIVVPIVLVVLVIVMIVSGVVCIICYRMPCARTKGVFKVSESQANMAFNLIPAPVSSKNTSLEGQHQYYESDQLATPTYPEWRQTDDWGNDFMEIEPTRVPVQALLSESNLRRSSMQSHNPQEYNYVQMDEIRARKAEERERKQQQRRKNSQRGDWN